MLPSREIMVRELLTAERLAEVLGCKTSHINSLASSGKLSAVRYGHKQALLHLEQLNPATPAVSPTLRTRHTKPPAVLTKTVQVAIP